MGTKDIWNAFSVELLGFIKSRISDVHIVEDILQEVFVKISLRVIPFKRMISLLHGFIRLREIQLSIFTERKIFFNTKMN
jgi:hypothetical protein